MPVSILNFADIGIEVGELVETKNKAYGNSWEDSPKFLELLWPKGIPVEAYTDMQLLVRIFDKMKRIATDKKALGESPYRDIAGYGIIGAANDERGIDVIKLT